MASHRERKEPVFLEQETRSSPGKHPQGYAEPADASSDSPALPENNNNLIFKVAAVALILACGLYMADRLYQRYLEQQALREINSMVEGWIDQANAMNEQMSREARERQRRLMQQRANSREGRWLGRNCYDWRQTHAQMPGPTSQTEMKRHCDLYERYLQTGVTPPGIRL